ncbi:hypothetical protein CPC16_008543 [Podila verticillata]|nr:hypothetical protein CPC16_008543 [Podila verticillata]
MSTASPMLPSSTATTSTSNPSTVDFDPEEFRINLMRQISDKLETGLDRHFSQLVSAASLSLPLSPDATYDNGSENSHSSTSATKDAEEALSTITQLKKVLRHTTAELERIKGKNQELRDENHKLELQRLEACHQVSRLQSFDLNNQFLLARVKELESSSGIGSPMEGDIGRADSLDTVSTSGRYNGEHFGNLQHVQQLMREVSSLTSERDALKIRAWELEKKPFVQQQVRSVHYVDLENERNRLLEELGAKTVATEELWNKNEALMMRANEYEKRVWELESQCSSLEAECASLPLLQADLAEMEARAVAADALVTKLQDMEGQLALVKSLQDRVQELETTNAELDHANWDLSERLNIANNQHALLTKEFESFRSKDKDDRRLEFLATRNRELEALLQEQAKTSPNYKDEFDRISSEYEKVKIRLPQLEGQAKQVALLRSKTLQLEKQIKTMEQLEPRLEEMQQLHERNLFLEGELGELELLRAREMELESELEESKTRLTQLESNKGRMASFSGLKQLTRARSGSVAHHPPFISAPVQANEDEKEKVNTEPKVISSPSPLRRGLSISSLDMVLSPNAGAIREFPQASSAPTASNWPSGRSSMTMSMATNRMSTSSNASSNSSSVMSNTSTIQNSKLTPSEEPESFIQPEISNNIPSSANDYWEQFWILPESAEDVFLLVGSQDIRRVRDEARENLECLLEKTLAHLFRLVESPQFLGPQAPASQVLNCIRILTRLFPFIFESDELMDWEERYFWTPRSVVVSSKRKITSTLPALSVSTMARSNQQDAITPIEALNDQTTSFAGQKEEFLELEEKSVPSYGQRLILTLQNLLFTSGFTLPAALEPKSRVTFVIWETGIGSSKPIGTTKELDDNRAEVLRLLLVLFSRSMYIAPAAITTTENRWIDTVVTSTDRQATLAILCSLINSALKYNPSGWGLPYNHVMFSDQRDLLVMLSLQVVVVLLDYQVVERPTSVYHPDVRVDSASHGVTSYSSPPPQLQRSMSLEPGNKNQFRYYLSRLHREQDFQFLIDGMYRILSNPMTASSTYLPGSTKHVKYHHETLILCWKTLELNKTVHHLIATTKRALRSLYPALISTLANVSPHLKNISPLASSRLMQLTTSFASPSFLLAEESNHGLLGSLLDTVCSILYYQASDNPHLIYALSEEQNGNKSSSRIEAPVLARPISSDSIMAASDGGGHDGDVEDEGGPSTVMRGSRTERTPHVLSEKARGKLPEGHRAPPFTREPSSDIDQQAIDFASSKKEHTSTAGGSKLGRRSSSTILGPEVDGKSQQEQETTAKDVGQNGFIPTAEWVA